MCIYIYIYKSFGGIHCVANFKPTFPRLVLGWAAVGGVEGYIGPDKTVAALTAVARRARLERSHGAEESVSPF